MTMLRIVANAADVDNELNRREPSDIELLHAISMDLIGEHDLTALYGKIVDAAMSITGSQFGTMQLLRKSEDGSDKGLELLISRGLAPQDRAVWEFVRPTAHSSCTAALKSGRRAIISDFEAWDQIAGTDDLLAFRRAGIRSAQTTPLRSRQGTLLGMISTHWSEPHEPSERDLRLLDILARQAADLLDRTMAENALRAREAELEKTVSVLRETEELQKVLTGELGHRVKNLFAMVTAISSHTLRGSSDQARVQTLQQRLMALSSAHDILLQSSWQSALLGDVAAAAVNGAGVAGRVRLDGPDIAIGSKASLSLALLLHELTTNALKHGSLSVGSGQVDVSWRVEQSAEDEVLRLTWRESKGPEIVKPTKTGFGSRLISAGLVGSGVVFLAYNSTGLVCEVSARIGNLQGAE
ncbi:GAF domain-containing protein [Shinella curvata]|uniref:histidine kinase n=1 Tax=Shinella curvata TaxID=1817964 RepID=A0ABT8XMY0_9HYPH|nr:HWE histidine kinase domain-containing protein [Shinella curvata]MCJ8056573.1 GAF domain-containing protein [Shinella curvata]MDO6125101.1 GAF domain-containing protein [Shinella curvata]